MKDQTKGEPAWILFRGGLSLNQIARRLSWSRGKTRRKKTTLDWKRRRSRPETALSHPSWKEIKRLGFSRKNRIRSRDQFKCGVCGEAWNGGPTFEVHHLNFDEKDNHPSNLLTVCGKCHRAIHFERKRSEAERTGEDEI